MADDDPSSRLDGGSDERFTIAAGRASASIDARAGGRVEQISVGNQPLFITPDASRAATTSWGSFPMAPWVGRIRHGRFDFDGRAHQLVRNHLDGPEGPDDQVRRHAIHGTVFARSWVVDSTTSTTIAMHCSLSADGWPFAGGVARQHIEISERSLECGLTVETADIPFPAVIGWHPWLIAPDRLHFQPDAMYRRDRLGIPTGALGEPTAGPWDDCFIADGPVVAEYERDDAPRVSIAADCDHWVIFDEHAGALCIEPQSGPPDGLNIGHELVTSGRPLERAMRISW
ncbi:MAG: aldose epimerase [Acidimicrobiia bacterium]|nr:aldose epimerase [Acidimicrobiia bacterium]